MSNDKEWVTPGYVAGLFGVSYRTVRLWANDGRFGEVHRTTGGWRRFQRSHVDAVARTEGLLKEGVG